MLVGVLTNICIINFVSGKAYHLSLSLRDLRAIFLNKYVGIDVNKVGSQSQRGILPNHLKLAENHNYKLITYNNVI